MKISFRNIIRQGNLYKLASLNLKRCNLAAIFLSVFIPLILFINIVFFHQTLIRPEYNKYLFSILITSLVYLVISYKVEHTRRFKKYTRPLYELYLIIDCIFMAMLSNSFFKVEGSLFYFFLAMIFFAIVPVFNFFELLSAELAVITFMTYIVWSNDHLTSLTMQVVLFNFVRIAVTIWKYGITYKNLELNHQVYMTKDVKTNDDLTGLLNKNGIFRKLSNIWSVSQKNKVSSCFLIIGVDYFKKYSEIYGEEKANETIVLIANAIKETVRERTDLIARIDSKKFLVILNEVEKKELIYYSKAIERKISQLNIEHSGNKFSKKISVTIGSSYSKNSASCDYMSIFNKCNVDFSNSINKKKEELLTVCS